VRSSEISHARFRMNPHALSSRSAEPGGLGDSPIYTDSQPINRDARRVCPHPGPHQPFGVIGRVRPLLGRRHRSLGYFPLVRREGRQDLALLTSRDPEVIEGAPQLRCDFIDSSGAMCRSRSIFVASRCDPGPAWSRAPRESLPKRSAMVSIV
jgi:hypothetical protein